MKKMIKKIKEKDNLIVFLLILCISFGISMNMFISSNDEIWNFQNVYKMYNGFKIYQDINVIITPMFFWCANMIFHILGANLFVFRISHCFVMAILFLFIYKILKKIDIPKSIALLVILLLSVQEFFLIIRTSFNYNNMAFMFTVIGIYVLISNKSKRNWIIQAIISILIFLTKQNIGIYYILATIIYRMISNDTKTQKIKQIVKYITLTGIGIVLFLLGMLIDNNLLNFLNYTFGGILEFADENVIIEIPCVIYIVGITIINAIVSIFIIKKKYFLKEQEENIKILFTFSIVFLLISYPIVNWSHVLLGTMISVINLVYIVYTIFKDFEKNFCKIVKIIDFLFVIILIAFVGYHIMVWGYHIKSNEYPYSWEEPFFGGIIQKEEYETNKRVVEYIKNNDKNVIVLSNRAALYMIPLKRNNGDFDLPFKGNFGMKGEKGLIEKVQNITNTTFLIYENESSIYYQEVEETKEYIKNNKQYTGKIEKFSIYE